MASKPVSLCLGFSLIEAAIVLAIVGLVVSGIWTAASAIAFNMRMNNVMALFEQAVREGQKNNKILRFDLPLGGEETRAMGMMPQDWTVDLPSNPDYIVVPYFTKKVTYTVFVIESFGHVYLHMPLSTYTGITFTVQECVGIVTRLYQRFHSSNAGPYTRIRLGNDYTTPLQLSAASLDLGWVQTTCVNEDHIELEYEL